MGMPCILGLRSDIWAKSSPTERVAALQELENYFAHQDGRQPCQIHSSNELAKGVNGVHKFGPDGNERIDINANLIQPSQTQPYQAVETLCHESRHAYQHHVVNNPELAENQDKLQDWQMNLDGGYLEPPETPETRPLQDEYFLDYSEYRWQPVEADANDVARRRTDELYQDTFEDTTQYPAYKEEKERELVLEEVYAEDYLGENYKEEAYRAMVAKYQAKKDMSLQQGDTDLEQGAEQATAPEQTEPEQLEAAEEASQEGAVAENQPIQEEVAPDEAESEQQAVAEDADREQAVTVDQPGQKEAVLDEAEPKQQLTAEEGSQVVTTPEMAAAEQIEGSEQVQQAEDYAQHEIGVDTQSPDQGESGQQEAAEQVEHGESVAHDEVGEESVSTEQAATQSVEGVDDAHQVGEAAEEQVGVQTISPEASESGQTANPEDNPANQAPENISQDSSESQDYQYGYGY